MNTPNNNSNDTSLFSKLVQRTKGVDTMPAMSLYRDIDPIVAATVSKLVAPALKPGVDRHQQLQPEQASFADYKNQSDQIAQSITDARTIYQTLPDLELGIDILVACVLSPKDMQKTELTYTLPDGLFPSEVQSLLLEALKEHTEQTYRIKPRLPVLLKRCLGETGSYPVAVLPENAVDDIINGRRNFGVEALSESFDERLTIRPRGLLGPVTPIKPKTRTNDIRLALESVEGVPDHMLGKIDQHIRLTREFEDGIDTGVMVSDNPDIMKLPELYSKLRNQSVFNKIRPTIMQESEAAGLENYRGPGNDLHLMNITHNQPMHNYTPINVVRSQSQLSRAAVGEPLVVVYPSEAVIPVVVPGMETKHIGYFVLLDPEGNPLQTSRDTNYFNQLRSRMSVNSSFASQMLNKISSNINGFNWQSPEHTNSAARVYGTMIERELMERFRNGVYGRSVKISAPDEIWRLMLARSLSQEQTQMLFIPVEFFTYFAFDYDERGAGKHLLEDIKIICAQRAALQYANTLAGIRNATGRTKVDIKLDEADPEPLKTAERLKHEIVRTRQGNIPLGTNTPIEIVDVISAAGLEICLHNHPALPDVEVDFSEHNSNYTKPDTEIMDQLAKLSLNGLGLTPENVDAANAPEFATSLVHNSIMLTKRTMQIQDMFTPQLVDHLRKYAMNSSPLLEKLRKVLSDNLTAVMKHLERKERDEAIRDNRAQDGQTASGTIKNSESATSELKTESREAMLIINHQLFKFLDSFDVHLPQPNSVSLKNQMEAYREYKEAITDVIEAYISDRYMNSDTMGELANQVNMIKEATISYYLRRYLAENGLLTELGELLSVDDEGNPAVNIVEETNKVISQLNKSLGNLMQGLDLGKTENKDLIENELDNPPGGGSYTPPSSSDDSGTDTDGGDGNDDSAFDFGADFTSMDKALNPDEDEGENSEPDATADKPADDKGETEPGAEEPKAE